MRTRAVAEAFAAARQAFLEHLRARHYSPRSCALVEQVLPKLFAQLARHGLRDPRAIEERHLWAYLRELGRARNRYGQPLSSATLQVHAWVLRRFFAFLERRGAILRNPALELSLPKASSLPKAVLGEAQARRLMETPPSSTRLGLRDRAILETLYGTGLRLSECARLDLADVDLAEGRLLVRDGKGKQDRAVPLAGRAAAALALYLREVRPALVHEATESAVFLSFAGTRLQSGTLYVLVKGHARAAGLALSPHGLRHACATHLLDRGADVRHIQALLGHSQLQTTATYTRVAMKTLRQALERAHPRRKTARKR